MVEILPLHVHVHIQLLHLRNSTIDLLLRLAIRHTLRLLLDTVLHLLRRDLLLSLLRRHIRPSLDDRLGRLVLEALEVFLKTHNTH